MNMMCECPGCSAKRMVFLVIYREAVGEFPSIKRGWCPNCGEQIFYYRDSGRDRFIGRDQLVALEESRSVQLEAQKGE